MSKTFTKLILHTLAIWLICTSAIGQSSKKVVLVSSNSHFGLVHRIEALLYAQPNMHPVLKHQVIDERLKEIDHQIFDNAHFAVTVGTEALSATLATGTTTPILSILIREHAFQQILKEHERVVKDHTTPITALYLDQPFNRQFDLIKTLLPSKQPIPTGILLQSRSTPDPIHAYHIEVPDGIKVITSHTNAFENPSEALEVLLEESRVLLAIPDVSIYNAKSARGILLTAYHKRIPVFAYSRTFVNNGALAAVYCTPKQISQQTSKIMTKLLKQDVCQLPAPTYPDDFAVAINYQVANTLGLYLPNESQIQKAIQEKAGTLHEV